MVEESLPAWNLVRTAHLVGLRFVELLAAVDLSPTQFAVLMHLEQGQGLSQAELARRVLVRPQSVGTLVSSLVERGYIVREGPGGRGRRAGIAVTDAGREAMERAWPAVRALNTPDAMGITPAQAAMLEEILDHIRHMIEEGN